MRVDGIRDEIDRLDADAGRARAPAHEPPRGRRPRRQHVRPADGLRQAVGARAPHGDLELREPRRVAGPAGTVSRRDANELAAQLDGVDCAYLDPPYNQHSYFSNYHIWETLVRWDRPDTYGVACKRVDCRTTKSAYNRKREAWDAFAAPRRGAADAVARRVLHRRGVSRPPGRGGAPRREGLRRAPSPSTSSATSAPRSGSTTRAARSVGQVSHLRNTEVLFVVGPDETVVADAVRELASAPGAAAAA